MERGREGRGRGKEGRREGKRERGEEGEGEREGEREREREEGERRVKRIKGGRWRLHSIRIKMMRKPYCHGRKCVTERTLCVVKTLFSVLWS